jgi:hypothetical protein
MTRTLAVVLSALALGACDVGTVLNQQGSTVPDGGKTDGAGSGNGCINLNPNSAPDGHHNAGMNCLTATGCHGTAPGAGGTFAFGGTLVDGAGNGVGGATIIITPTGGTPIKVLTAVSGGAGPGAGNFYYAGTANLQGATVSASGCPNVASMVATLVTAGGGGCNNCHKAGGQAPPAHLP